MRRRTLLTAAAALALPGLARAQDNSFQLDIEPTNELERVFVAAYDDAAERPHFRRLLLDSDVALALANSAPDSAPKEVATRSGGRAGLIFTSDSRMNIVMGPGAPRVRLRGRTALERLRGKHVIVNYQLVPMLVLEPDDVAEYLTPSQPSVGAAQ